MRLEQMMDDKVVVTVVVLANFEILICLFYIVNLLAGVEGALAERVIRLVDRR